MELICGGRWDGREAITNKCNMKELRFFPFRSTDGF